MERNVTRKRNRKLPSALKTIHTVLGCWRTHESLVVPQWKIFRRSRNFVVPCLTYVLGRKRLSCLTTAHGPTLFVCAWTGFGWSAETYPPSTLQVWPGLRTAVCSGLWRIRCVASTMQKELLKRGSVAKGMFRHLEWWQIFIDWD